MTLRTASCSCGQLTAIASGDPARVSVCHCLACQRRSGSAFAAQAKFPAGAVTIAGRSNTFVLTGDEGTRATFHSCPACAATVYYTRDVVEDSVFIPVGAFADPAFPPPTISVYDARRHPWVGLPADIEHWD